MLEVRLHLFHLNITVSGDSLPAHEIGRDVWIYQMKGRIHLFHDAFDFQMGENFLQN
jgi:hypothetical protein